MADTKISALTTDSSPNRGADYLPTYDASAGATKKVLLNNVGVLVLTAGASASSPADATTYYFGNWQGLSLNTVAGERIFSVLRAGIITKVDLWVANASGSSTTSTVYLRVNNTTDNTLTSSFATNAAGRFSCTGLSISVAATDYVEFKWITPTWPTNPTNIYLFAQIFLE
jgi:hypothetical protein